MKTTTDLYHAFINNSRSRIGTLTIRVSTMEKRINYILSILACKKRIIESETSLRLNRFGLREYPLSSETYRRNFTDNDGFDIIMLQSYVKAYNKMCRIRFNSLKEIRTLSRYLNITYREFKFITTRLHLGVCNILLNGGTYNARGLGTFCIAEHNIKLKDKLYIDRSATAQAKKSILQSGKTLYSKDNPTGEKYIIYKHFDYRYYCVFKRTVGCLVENGEKINLKFTTYNHTGKYLNELVHCIDIKDVNNLPMGLVDKMILALKVNPTQYLKYRR